MNFREQEKLASMLKEKYKKGMIVECMCMNDIHGVPTGTKGIIDHVDDLGTIHVNWENGSSLGLIYGEDSFMVI